MKTSEFLALFPDFAIQTFDDREVDLEKKDKSLITCGSIKTYQANALQTLNEKGAGIFFTPNRFPSGKRAKNLCTGVNAWFVENDTLSPEEQIKNLSKCDLPPTLLVRSKKSIHAYWLAKNGTIENFGRVQKGLIKYFSGDEACKDISRVLRIPGFFHNKNGKFPVEVIEFSEDRIYTERDMLVAFPFAEEIKPEYKPSKPFSDTSGITVWEALGKLDNRMVLEKLSGSPIVNHEHYTFRERSGDGGFYIDVNGKPANAWIDKNGLVGSASKAGPTWIQWLEYYGWSKSDILKWAKETFPQLIPKEEKPHSFGYTNSKQPVDKSGVDKSNIESKYLVTHASDHMDEIRQLFESPPSTYTWGTEKLDVSLPSIEKGHYIIMFGQSGAGKSLYSLYMAKQNSLKNKGVVFLSLEMSKKQFLSKYARDRAGITKEMYRMRNFDTEASLAYIRELDSISFVGIDEGDTFDVEKIERVINETESEFLIVDNLNKIQGKGRGELEVTQGVSQGILNLTRKYKIPILIIHHANKPAFDPKKNQMRESQYIGPAALIPSKNDILKRTVLRGLEGMRGTMKTADDADVVLEVARPTYPDNYEMMSSEACTSVISVYKDRDFDLKSKSPIFFHKGNFYDSFEEVMSLPSFDSKKLDRDNTLVAVRAFEASELAEKKKEKKV